MDIRNDIRERNGIFLQSVGDDGRWNAVSLKMALVDANMHCTRLENPWVAMSHFSANWISRSLLLPCRANSYGFRVAAGRNWRRRKPSSPRCHRLMMIKLWNLKVSSRPHEKRNERQNVLWSRVVALKMHEERRKRNYAIDSSERNITDENVFPSQRSIFTLGKSLWSARCLMLDAIHFHSTQKEIHKCTDYVFSSSLKR